MARHRHSRKRRNPSAMTGVVPLVGGVIAGGLGARMIPQAVLGASNTGIMGYAANGAVAVAGGLLLGRWNKSAGMGFLGGGLAALAIRVYQDYTSGAGAAGSSDGTMGLYIGSSFPIPTYTTGNPLNAGPYNFAGAPLSVAAGGQPASAAAIQTAIPGNAYGRRLKGRFAPN